MSGLELHEACSVGDSDYLEELLRTGRYDVDMKDNDWQDRAPIHWACSKGYVECLRLLLDYGADPAAQMSMGWSPAHCAAETGKLHILRALHAAGGPIHLPDHYGDPPQRVAAVYGHTDCVKYFAQIEQERKENKSSEPEGAGTGSDVAGDGQIT